MYFLTHARHETGRWQGITLNAGQLVVGRKAISEKTGVSERAVRTAIERLKTTSTITTETTNKYTLVTIVNWDFYQNGGEKTTNKTTNETTNERPANDQQTTTNKNVNKEKNVEEVVVVHDGDETQRSLSDILEYYGFSNTQSDIDKLSKHIREYSSEWVFEALERTSEQSVDARNWKYVKAILDRWKNSGGIDPAVKQNTALANPQDMKVQQHAKRKEKYNYVMNGEIFTYEREV